MKLEGVIPAALTPWREDFSLDSVGLEKHLNRLLKTPGTIGVLVNGNTSEVAACSFDEQEEILETAVRLAEGKKAVLSGVQLGDTAGLEHTAKRWQSLGADALLVFPPASINSDDRRERAALIDQWKSLSAATNLPLVLFQYSTLSGRSYSLDLLHTLATEVSSFAGVKDFCGDEALHRKTIEMMHAQFHLPVVTSHTKWLRKSLALGVDGIFSSAGSIFSKEQAEIYAATNANAHVLADELSRDLETKMALFSGATLGDQLPAFKVAAAAYGDFPCVQMRPPLQPMTVGKRLALTEKLQRLGVFEAASPL